MTTGAVDVGAMQIFLLTRPSRDVTLSHRLNILVFAFLLTRPSRDVTAYRTPHLTQQYDFYSHVPRGT